MIWPRKLVVAMIMLLIIPSLSLAYALPSGGKYPPTFTFKDGDWYDSWGFDRNYYGGSKGFLPNVAYETIGSYKELAWKIGERFMANYPNRVDRAEAILKYVQRWTDYGYDIDNIFINSTGFQNVNGKPQDDFAWNADEMAHMFNETTGAVAIGDCEDMAFLCSTIYLAAGFDVTLVSPTGHVALMIWLPEYANANYIWDLQDGRGEGWIWVEATGKNNPLGWTPPDFSDGNFDVYPLSSIISNVNYTPQAPQATDYVTVTASVATQNGPISQVLLYYSINGGSYRTLAMALVGSSYEATVPKQADGAVVKFYVSVTDAQGTVSESSESSYTVGGGLEIPGFPPESIIVGLAVGLVALYFLARKRAAPSMPSTLRV